MSLGLRVLRGPDWEQRDSDGGEGHLGTVVGVKAEEGTAEVVWDNGQVTTCHVGKEGKHDLRILDNGPAGIKHRGVICDSCGKNIFGIRWKCSVCHDFDLCTICYCMDKDDPLHEYHRHVKEGVQRVSVGRRSGARQVRVAGIFPGARVTRGRDWESGDVDGGAGGVGTVVEVVSPESGSARNAVRVSWDSSQSLQHRLGLHGKVDLVLSKVSPVAPPVYIDHLPVLEVVRQSGGAQQQEGFRVGDRVKVEADEETFKRLQRGRGGWCVGLRKCFGQTGLVRAVTAAGDVDVQFADHMWRLHPEVLKKGTAARIVAGDTVLVMDDWERVKALQEGHGGWVEDMKECAGKTGRVRRVDSDGDLRVQFSNGCWALNPVCCLPVSGGNSDDTDDSQQSEGLPSLADLLRSALRSRMAGESEMPETAREFAQAIRAGNASRVAEFLDREPDLIRQVIRGGHPLHLAADSGEAGVASLLLDRGADINQGDEDDDTPLILAVDNGHLGVVHLLLERGADVNLANEDGYTALHKAAYNGHTDICRLLLANGADICKRDTNGQTAVYSAIKNQDSAELMEVLLSAPDLDLRMTNSTSFNPLHFAALTGRPNSLVAILTRDASLLNVPTEEESMTPLHIAAYNDNVEDLRILIQAGADLNPRSNDGYSPLHLACHEDYIDCVMALLESGADVNAVDNDGMSALHLVTRATNREEESALQMANYLVQQGARTDLRDAQGMTALDRATPTLRLQIQDFIRECGQSGLLENSVSSQPITTSQATETTRAEVVPSAELNPGPQLEVKGATSSSPKCITCSVAQATVIFLPCAHKLLCPACSQSVFVCSKCQGHIKNKIDIEGNHIAS